MDDKPRNIVEAAKSMAGKAADLARGGADAMRALTDEVNELLPAIRKAGYAVQGVDLDVAIPPKVSVHCKLLTDLAEDERTALLTSLEGRPLVAAAVTALFRVADAQARLSLGSLRPSDVILEVGVTPAVKVRYREPGTTPTPAG